MALYHQYLIDTERNWLFNGFLTDITAYVKSASWGFGMQSPYDSVPAPAFMTIVLNNSNGDFTLEDTNATYYGKIRKGVLIRVRASQDAINWVNLCTLQCKNIRPQFPNGAVATEILLEGIDILPNFLNSQYIPPLQTNVRIDQALTALHEGANAIYPYESYYQFIGHTSIGDGKAPFYGLDFIDFETAETTLPFAGDNLDRGQGISVAGFVRDLASAEVYGMYYWSPRDELFHFLSRYHAADEAIVWYLTNLEFVDPTINYARYLYNDVTINYHPRLIGAAESVLWESDSLPLAIAGKSTRRLIARYRDPNQESATVGALEVLDLVPDVDYIANLESDGSGIERTTRIRIFAIKGTTSTELFITNNAGGTVYMTTLQIRGTPITAYNKETARSVNDTSIYENVREQYDETLFAVNDSDFAQDYADFLANVYGTPRQELERVQLSIKDNSNSSLINQVLNRTIGNVINISDAINHHSGDYMIVGEQHSVNASDNLHNVTYTLRPTNRGNLFILGTSGYDDGDVLAF